VADSFLSRNYTSNLQTMASILQCGLIQPDVAWRDPATNFRRLDTLMNQLPGCDLYILPETCTTGFPAGIDLAEPMDGPSVSWLLQQAGQRNAAIAAGVLIEEDDRIFNRMVVAKPDGTLSHYDKRHLFSYAGEDKAAGYSPGIQRSGVQFDHWRVDLQICYDLRFPVWCRNQASEFNRYDLQLFVANWPAPRIEAWLALLKARAIENQAYVIGVNRVGTDPSGTQYSGQSAVYDADGHCLVQLENEPAAVMVELDLEKLNEIRTRLPFLPDRDRFELG